jgi:hypothetical protein
MILPWSLLARRQSERDTPDQQPSPAALILIEYRRESRDSGEDFHQAASFPIAVLQKVGGMAFRGGLSGGCHFNRLRQVGAHVCHTFPAFSGEPSHLLFPVELRARNVPHSSQPPSAEQDCHTVNGRRP